MSIVRYSLKNQLPSFVVVLLLCAPAVVKAKEHLADQSAYPCHYASFPMKLDGRLDEAIWKRAPVVKRFNVFRPKGKKYPGSTAGQLAWDDKHLYVAFRCTDNDVYSCSSKHDDYLAAGDVVELYVKYNKKVRDYLEFVSAPNGTTFDCHWPARRAGSFQEFRGWESGMKVATTIDGTGNQRDDKDRGFIVEMAIPHSAFDKSYAPQPGRSWLFGLFRYDHSTAFKEPCLLMSLRESPEHGFHYYEAYHKLVFVKDRSKTSSK